MLWNSPTIDDKKSPCKRAFQFFSRLIKGIGTAFMLATLSLVGLNTAMNYATAQPSPAIAAQTRDADLPTYAEKLTATCSLASQVVLMTHPAARCMELVAQTAQQLLVTGFPARMLERLSINTQKVTVKSLKVAAYRLTPSWLDVKRRSAIVVLH